MRPVVAKQMAALQEQPLNASSVHVWGREAKKHLEASRKIIAEAISAWPNEITFTASGTEANITALRGITGRRVLVSAIEHSSVLKATDAAIFPVTTDGIVDLDALDALLATSENALVSVMLANNETGVIQPIADISTICKRHGALLHCDAIQALGKIPVDFGALGVDMMSLSAHKCGGPVGAAALVVRRELPFVPLMTGGGQESGRRAGTENIAAITGFAAAVQATDLSQMNQLRHWLTKMETILIGEGALVFGKNSPRLPTTSCIAMPDVSNEVQLMDFDLNGFCVSAGSACSSGRIEISHVLKSMKIDEKTASYSIRVSGGWNTAQQQIQAFTQCWQQTHQRLRKKVG